MREAGQENSIQKQYVDNCAGMVCGRICPALTIRQRRQVRVGISPVISGVRNMKVGSSSSVTGRAASASASGGSGAAFVLPTGGPAARPGVSAMPAMTGVASLDALLALQETAGPLERRKKALGRAGRILDVLDDLQLAVLDGNLPASALERLVRAVRDQRQETDDAGLEGLLDQIETRAAVELAKLQRSRAAA